MMQASSNANRRVAHRDRALRPARSIEGSAQDGMRRDPATEHGTNARQAREFARGLRPRERLIVDGREARPACMRAVRAVAFR
jgi:hypothetical protein